MDISREGAATEIRIHRGDELEAVAVSLYAHGRDGPRSQRAHIYALGERATDTLARNAHQSKPTHEFVAFGEDAELVGRALAHLVLKAEGITHPLTVDQARRMHMLFLRVTNTDLPATRRRSA